MENSLDKQILELLNRDGKLTAREIALKLGVEKQTVNGLLYGALSSHVGQDSAYRWSLKNEPAPIRNQPEDTLPDNPLSRLCKYYLECLARDMDEGISAFATSKYGNPEYALLGELPFTSNSMGELFTDSSAAGVIRKVNNDPFRLQLVLGYPLYHYSFTSRKGEQISRVAPLFLFYFEKNNGQLSGETGLQNIVPIINPECLKQLEGIDERYILNSILALEEELGLSGENSSPEVDDMLERLKSIRTEWPWMEPIDPDNLNQLYFGGDSENGIYNKAGLFVTQGSKYTQGLERELSDLIRIRRDGYLNTVIGLLTGESSPQSEAADIDFVQPIPLNDEQKEAVLHALTRPLTVVTGPPGTGKSQVVTSIIVNALYNGQKVLFASKNNKAVNVVCERVNGLSTSPMLIRLGNNELHSGLADFITQTLSAKSSESDLLRFEEAKNRQYQLSVELATIARDETDLIELRNKLNEQERLVEDIRDEFNDLFIVSRSLPPSFFSGIQSGINQIKTGLGLCKKENQGFLTRLVWFKVGKDRLDQLSGATESLIQILSRHRIPFSLNLSENDEVTRASVLLEHVTELTGKLKKAKKYWSVLAELTGKPGLPELAKKRRKIVNQIEENSSELWDGWSRTLSGRLTGENRRILGDYATVLKLIARAQEENSTPEKQIWKKYYELLPRVSGIFSAWAVTSLSVRSRVPFSPGFFDLLIIDEASQCDIASAMPLLYRAKRAVIIGDSNQLSHISKVSNKQEIALLYKAGLEDHYLKWAYATNSLFDMATASVAGDDVIVLRDHHRSHSDIITFSNNHFYREQLRIESRYEKLKFLDNEPVVRWVDVQGAVNRPANGGAENREEAIAVCRELRRLADNGYSGSIGMVSPFRAQANLIRDLINRDQSLLNYLNTREFLADTVHAFQGDERDIIIFSPVVSKGLPQGPLVFLKRTGNLFNVAITRARAGLIIIGDKMACSSSGIDYLARFVDYCNELGKQTDADDSATASISDWGSTYPKAIRNEKVSDWEVVLYERLYREGIHTIPQYAVDQYRLDLALISGDHKLDIEVDGEMYHRSWNGELVKRDQLRNLRLMELGWDVQRFWVYEIRDDLDGCIKRIKHWLKNLEQVQHS